MSSKCKLEEARGTCDSAVEWGGSKWGQALWACALAQLWDIDAAPLTFMSPSIAIATI